MTAFAVRAVPPRASAAASSVVPEGAGRAEGRLAISSSASGIQEQYESAKYH